MYEGIFSVFIGLLCIFVDNCLLNVYSFSLISNIYNNERSGIGWKYMEQNYAFIINNINDKSNPNVPENDQDWIEIVVMAIIFT